MYEVSNFKKIFFYSYNVRNRIKFLNSSGIEPVK